MPDLVARARALVGSEDRRAVLGVTGAPGAGKSTLVERLLTRLRTDPPPGCTPEWVAHLPMDGFHLADAQLRRLGRLERKGAPDTFDVDGYAAVLRRCRDEPGRTVFAPGFERDLEQPLAAALAVVPEARLVVTEGNYLLLRDDDATAGWGRVAPLLDQCWFVEVADDLRRSRLVARHERFGKTPAAARAWTDAVDEPSARLVAAARDRADLVVHEVDLP